MDRKGCRFFGGGKGLCIKKKKTDNTGQHFILHWSACFVADCILDGNRGFSNMGELYFSKYCGNYRKVF